MGYSYAARAGYTLDAIGKLIDAIRTEKGLPDCSNGTPDGGFWEHGREQADGAIVGTVWKPYAPDPSKVERRGSFRIEPNGKVKRFPGLPAALLRQAEAMGEATFKANHGTWRERGAAFLPKLESGEADGKLSWSWFESIFAGWQREARIMFAAMPHANNADMAEALRHMLAG